MNLTRRQLMTVLFGLVWTRSALAQGRRGTGAPQRPAAPARGTGENARTPRDVPKGVASHLDLAYVVDGHPRQKLDLFVPEKATGPLPLVIWIHGGGFWAGSKDNATPLPLTAKGFAVASVDYRLSQHASFPAQIEDCKAAVRWLRANSQTYNLDTEHFGAWGSSAGGHLVALLGTSGDVKDLEGQGGHLDQTSRVQAVVDWFGPTDFLKMGGSHDQPGSPESRLIGGPLQQNKEKANRANPIAYINANTPPFLIMHGTNDAAVPFNQSELLHAALEQAGVDVTFVPLRGGRHGDPAFWSSGNLKRVEEFLTRHLKPGKR